MQCELLHQRLECVTIKWGAMDKRIVLIALVGLIVLNISCTNKTISHQRQQNDSLTVQEKADSLEKSDSLF